jgi:two-component system chemotaxis response regulator CheY
MGKMILVVDDSVSMRQLVSFTVRKAGYDVCEAVGGKEGLAKVTAQKIDMVITDVNMPEMNGLEFIKQIRERPEYKLTPILILTTETQEVMKQAGRQAGASAWIIKPFASEQLVELVNRLIRC